MALKTNLDYIVNMRERMEASAAGSFELFLADVREVCKTGEGLRVMRAIVDRCGIYHEVTQANAENYVRQGEQKVGLFIKQLLDFASPDGESIWSKITVTNMEDGHG